jgi:hypothetical protein
MILMSTGRVMDACTLFRVDLLLDGGDGDRGVAHLFRTPRDIDALLSLLDGGRILLVLQFVLGL